MNEETPCRRRLTYRMYPSPSQEQKLLWMKGAHKDLYNALLQQRIWAYQNKGVSLSRYDQADDVTALRQADPEELDREDNPYARLNAQSLQITLRRVERAFQHFFRKVRDPDFEGNPGFPRFKSFSRYNGWSYNHQSGWRIGPQGEDRPVGDDRVRAEADFLAGAHGRLWLQEMESSIQLRGEARDGIQQLARRGQARLKEITVLDKADGWYLSVVVECDRKPPRPRENDAACGLDWGVSTFATIAGQTSVAEQDGGGLDDENDGSFWEILPNPAPLKRAENKIRNLQQQLARKQKGSSRWQALKSRLARLHQTLERQRTDFLHKASAYLAENFELIVTEDVDAHSMTASARGTEENPGTNVAPKAALNRSILDTAPGRFADLLAYKAEEAGTRVERKDPAEHAPTQTCHRCGHRHEGEEKHLLSDRIVRCVQCGWEGDRDYSAARVLLHLGLYGEPVSPDSASRAGAPARRGEGPQRGSDPPENPSSMREVRRVA